MQTFVFGKVVDKEYITIANLCPNMIHFNAFDFSECRSEEVMFLLMLSVLPKTFWDRLSSDTDFQIYLENSKLEGVGHRYQYIKETIQKPNMNWQYRRLNLSLSKFQHFHSAQFALYVFPNMGFCLQTAAQA